MYYHASLWWSTPIHQPSSPRFRDHRARIEVVPNQSNRSVASFAASRCLMAAASFATQKKLSLTIRWYLPSNQTDFVSTSVVLAISLDNIRALIDVEKMPKATAHDCSYWRISTCTSNVLLIRLVKLWFKPLMAPRSTLPHLYYQNDLFKV